MQELCQVPSAKRNVQNERRVIAGSNPLFESRTTIRTLYATIAGLLLLSILLVTTTHAEEKRPIVRHVFVPVDNPKVWPKGDRELVPFAEYVELREANQSIRSARRGAQIEWQSLSATFEPSRGVLTGGRWEAEVRGSEKQPRLLSLEPLDLPISELRWADGDAVWGTAPSGDTLLMVDAAERRLEGRFSCQGRRLQRTWQFDLRLATATVSELKLRVPAQYSLLCSAATIRGPLTSGEESWRLWQLNLGSQSRCEVLIVESQTSVPTVPVVVYEQTSSYMLRKAELEVQCEINAEVFHTPKSTLEFVVPDELSIYTVGFAGDSRLFWRELPRVPGQPRQIEVPLPEPQIGRVRALHLLGGVTAKWQPARHVAADHFGQWLVYQRALECVRGHTFGVACTAPPGVAFDRSECRFTNVAKTVVHAVSGGREFRDRHLFAGGAIDLTRTATPLRSRNDLASDERMAMAIEYRSGFWRTVSSPEWLGSARRAIVA